MELQMNLMEAVRARHSVRSYLDRPVEREKLDALRALGGDLLVTCAYGQILTQPVLDSFPKGVWNIHAGLLPIFGPQWDDDRYPYPALKKNRAMNTITAIAAMHAIVM